MPWSVLSNPAILEAMGRMCSIRNPHLRTIPAWCTPLCNYSPCWLPHLNPSPGGRKAARNLILAMNGSNPSPRQTMCLSPNPFLTDERRYFLYCPEDTHNQLVEQAYAARGLIQRNRNVSAFPPMPPATVSTHNALKTCTWMIYLAQKGGCTPSATISA